MALKGLGARLPTALWIAGLVLLAVSAALGGRVAQEHLGARKAWMAASEHVGEEGYDAARSDALYERSAEALERLGALSRLGGAGMLALVVGLLLGRRMRARAAPPIRRIARMIVAVAVGLAASEALARLAQAPTDTLLGPAVAEVGHAAAPFVGATLAALVVLVRRRDT